MNKPCVQYLARTFQPQPLSIVLKVKKTTSEILTALAYVPKNVLFPKLRLRKAVIIIVLIDPFSILLCSSWYRLSDDDDCMLEPEITVTPHQVCQCQ